MFPKLVVIPPLWVITFNVFWLLATSVFILIKKKHKIIKQPDYSLLEHTYFINAIAISSNERYLISCGGDDLVIIWDLQKKKLYKRFEDEGWVGNVIFSSTNNVAYSLLGKNGTVSQIDVKSKSKATINGSFGSPCRGLALSASGRKMIVCGKNGSFTISSPELINSGNLIVKISETELSKVCIYENDSFAIGSKSGEIFYGKLLGNVSKRNIHKVYQEPDHEAVRGISFLDSMHIVFTDSGGKVNIICLSTKKVISQLAHNGHAIALCVSPNKRYIFTGGQDNRICCWQIKEGVLFMEFEIQGHSDDVTCMVLDKNFQLYSASRDNSIMIWSLFGLNLYK